MTLRAPTHRLQLKLRATIVSTSLVRKMTYIDPYSNWFFFFFIYQIQFLTLLIYMANALRMNCFGSFPETMTVIFTSAFTFVLAFLFGNFYIQAYLKKNEARNSKKAK